DLHHAQPLLEEAAGSLMTKIVEPQILDARSAARSPECLSNAALFQCEYRPFIRTMRNATSITTETAAGTRAAPHPNRNQRALYMAGSARSFSVFVTHAPTHHRISRPTNSPIAMPPCTADWTTQPAPKSAPSPARKSRAGEVWIGLASPDGAL